MPKGEPKFAKADMTLDTGATVHAADRLDFPMHEVKESAGSRVGQKFGGAGGKLLGNEGEWQVLMISLGGTRCEISATVQIAKITRPLFSLTPMISNGDISVVRKRDEASVLNSQKRTVAVFKRKCNLYMANLRVRNPRCKARLIRQDRQIL